MGRMAKFAVGQRVTLADGTSHVVASVWMGSYPGMGQPHVAYTLQGQRGTYREEELTGGADSCDPEPHGDPGVGVLTVEQVLDKARGEALRAVTEGLPDAMRALATIAGSNSRLDVERDRLRVEAARELMACYLLLEDREGRAARERKHQDAFDLLVRRVEERRRAAGGETPEAQGGEAGST